MKKENLIIVLFVLVCVAVIPISLLFKSPPATVDTLPYEIDELTNDDDVRTAFSTLYCFVEGEDDVSVSKAQAAYKVADAYYDESQRVLIKLEGTLDD